MLLTKNDKIVLKKLFSYKRRASDKRYYKKEKIKYIVEKYNKYLSPAFLKFLKIRCLLNSHYIIYNRYVDSLHYKELVKEIEEYIANYRKCLGCGKPIVIRAKKGRGSLGFIFSHKKTCCSSCLGKYKAHLYYDNATKEDIKQKTLKAQKTMIARYGAPTTLQSKVLKDKVRKTVNKRYGGNAPACNKEIAQKISNSLKGRKCLKN